MSMPFMKYLLACVCMCRLTTLLATSVTCSSASQFLQFITGDNDLDTVVMIKGHYEMGNVVIDKPIVIIGQEYPVLTSADGGEIFTIISNHVVVHGFEFRGVETNYLKENAAVHIKKSKHCLIENNRIIHCFFGIYLEHVKKCSVINNFVAGKPGAEAASGNGIHAWYCDSLLIENNDIKGHRDGIYFEFVHGSSIHHNVSFENTRYGLHFMFSNDDIYTGNTFENNGVGVAVMFSSRIEMSANLFQNNWGRSAYGLLLKEIRDAEISNNRFYYNTIGIYVEGSSRVNYEKNDFLRNGCALNMSGGCVSNRLFSNNFINNHLDMELHGSFDENTIEGNYWSAFKGYDIDKDNIGDTPHYPVKLFSHVLSQVPEAIVLMRSLLVDLINYAECVSPVFTPVDVRDNAPRMNEIE